MLCGHSRHTGIVLLAVAVLCVAIQILCVVQHSRNDKFLKQFFNDRLFSMRFTVDFQRVITTMQPQLGLQQPDLASKTEFIQLIKQEAEVRRERHHQNAQNMGNIPPVGQKLWGKAPSEQISIYTSQILKFSKTAHFQRGKGDQVEAAASNPKMDVKKIHPLRILGTDDLTSIQHGPSVTTKGSKPHRESLVSSRRTISPRLKLQRSTTALDNMKNGLDVNKEMQKWKLSPRSRTTPRPSSNRDVATTKTAAVQGASVCQPKTNIFFLKTHKTASSTILNILYRFGDSRNLTFALPFNKDNQLSYPYYFAAHFVKGFKAKAVKEYNIMCNHMRFMASEVKRVMPEDSFYFSILRNPVSMMESIFVYYKSLRAFQKARTLDDFLNNASHSYNSSLSNNHYAKNLLAFDFGFNNNNNRVDIEKQANWSISIIELNFQLILISEYFDESMILLKNALCWSLDDVVSFKLNTRSNKTRQVLSPSTELKIQLWNSLDWKIYQHFNATFWRKVEQTVGWEKMKREVAQLQDRRRQLMKTCLTEGGAVDPSQVKDSALKPLQHGAAVIQGYNLKPGLDGATKKQCQDLITPEMQYTAALYKKQFPDLTT